MVKKDKSRRTEILEKAAGLSLYYEGLLDEIKDFETGYKELYKN